MHVNNELGSINPIAEISKLKGNALFHSDAVQSYGKVDINAGGTDIDMATVQVQNRVSVAQSSLPVPVVVQ